MLAFKSCSMRVLYTSIPKPYYKHKGIALVKHMHFPQAFNGQLKRHYSNADAMEKTRTKTPQDEELKAFRAAFPVIVEDLGKNLTERKLQKVADWFTEVMNYNVPKGKLMRGLAVVECYKMLVNNPSEQQLNLSRVVGWCLEMVNTSFVIADDIVDNSLTRRGQPCWYKKENVGMKAINDAMMMMVAVYKILFKYFQDEKRRISIMDCITQAIWLAVNGQCLDMISTPNNGRPDLKNYSHDLYLLTGAHKVNYYSICVPLQLSLILAGKKEAYTHSVEELLLKMGYLLQIENDYSDCFGDPNITGKIGNDIEEGKCCWPILTALEMVNSDDEEILQNNYGSWRGAQKVKDVYDRIGLKDVYEKTKEEHYKNICKQVEVVSKESHIPEDIFFMFLNNIHRF